MWHRRGAYRYDHSERVYQYEPAIIAAFAKVIASIARGLWRFVCWAWRRAVSPGKTVAPATPPIASTSMPARPQSVPPVAHRHVPTSIPFARPVHSRDLVTPLPYRACEAILTDGEKGLWEPLHLATDGKYAIFAKVRLADVIECPRERRDQRRWFRKIGSYHVDFVICESHTTRPLLVIELDDRRHRSPDRQRIDAFKNRALAAALIPIYRILAQQAYDPLELRNQIDLFIVRKK